MFEWVRNLLGGGNNNVQTGGGSMDVLSREGFSPAYANSRTEEIRLALISFREHRDAILQHAPGEDANNLVKEINRACTSIEKVNQILRVSPSDFSRTGLSLEAIPAAERLLAECVQFAMTSDSKGVIAAAFMGAGAALSKLSTNFELLAGQRLQVDNNLKISSLAGTVTDLSESK